MNIIQKRLTALRSEMKSLDLDAWYISGTDPHDAESFLRLELEREGNALAASWDEQLGKQYLLESSDDLITWSTVTEHDTVDFFTPISPPVSG